MGWSVALSPDLPAERLPDALWGAIAGYGGFALLLRGYRLRYQKEGAWIWRRQVPHCLRRRGIVGKLLPLLVFSLAAMLANVAGLASRYW